MDKIELRKLDKLETHDRLLQYQKQADTIGIEVQKCIDNVPDDIKYPFYVWGHARQVAIDERFGLFMTGEFPSFEEVPSERILWIPRCEKPDCTPNSYLFRAFKGSDIVEIVWILPKLELWEQFAPGKMTHNQDVWTSILNFKYHRKELEYPQDGDMNEKERDEFRRIIRETAWWKRNNQPWIKI